MEVHLTESFADWLGRLRDHVGRAKVLVCIDRMRLGLIGDVKSVGHGVSEIRIHFGPGYRLYFVKRDRELILLLVGGDKGSQNCDIRKAHEMAARV